MRIADPVTITMDRRDWIFLLGMFAAFMQNPTNYPDQIHTIRREVIGEVSHV